MDTNGFQVRTLCAGRRIFSAEAWQRLALAFALSPRELEIVQQIFDDCTEASIATDLGISPHTVHTYVARVFHQLGVASRVQLVLRVVEQHQSAADPLAVISTLPGGDIDSAHLSPK